MNALMRVGLGFAIGSLLGALAMSANGIFPLWQSAGVLVGVALFLAGWLLPGRRPEARGHLHACPGCKRARWCEECPEAGASAMFCLECIGRMAKRE